MPPFCKSHFSPLNWRKLFAMSLTVHAKGCQSASHRGLIEYPGLSPCIDRSSVPSLSSISNLEPPGPPWPPTCQAPHSSCSTTLARVDPQPPHIALEARGWDSVPAVRISSRPFSRTEIQDTA